MIPRLPTTAPARKQVPIVVTSRPCPRRPHEPNLARVESPGFQLAGLALASSVGPAVRALRVRDQAYVTASSLSVSGVSVSRYGARYWAKTFAELAAWCVSVCSSDAVVG